MRVGSLLSTFRSSATPALEEAAGAAGAGLDGVFAFDHLWPMNSPERPALAPFPVLAAVAAAHPSLAVGPLVARVSLVAPEVLVAQVETLVALAPGRVVAALGTGDSLSVAEEAAYGLPAMTASERRARLRDVADALRTRCEVWVGAGGAATDALARELGVTLNFWDVSPERLAAAALEGPVSWAGPLRDDVGARLSELSDAGSTWVVTTATADPHELAAWARSR
ncbi:MAG TPA: LLM class flavin-dependent oxidoreductase [Acidimicrobiales bacterium]|nr:LLM class flavin-dependent oxidoreductase [Acidimicrobiales bacterium]